MENPTHVVEGLGGRGLNGLAILKGEDCPPPCWGAGVGGFCGGPWVFVALIKNEENGSVSWYRLRMNIVLTLDLG